MANLNLLELVTKSDLIKVRDALVQNLITLELLNYEDVYKLSILPLENIISALLEEQKGLTHEIAKRSWDAKIKSANEEIEKKKMIHDFQINEISVKKLALTKCNELIAQAN